MLVVDGLDEDGGVTTGPHAHSIAGLLPAEPPAGMRVIVAGRPNPPIPHDVSDWHPLRDPGIIRPLPASPYARDIGRLGGQELQRLLHGSAAEQDLLGLLTAARGGLSKTDLEELADISLWEIEEILHTVAGRTFTRRASHWAPATGPEVYLLGHEELQATASQYLGSRLAGYHDRLHTWARTYRTRRWPPGTPEYLLSGYFQLVAILGDLPGMIACAIDSARHDRMLDVTGVDTAALAEVRAALDLIAAQDDPDLPSALGLAFHRDQLTDRSTSIPVGLPAVWATLGQVTRAEALATSMTNPVRQTEALVQVAEALADSRQYDQAEAVARTITDSYWQAEALARVAGALARAGQRQEAEAVARAITDRGWQAEALARVAGALAGAGQHQQAGAVARQAEKAARAITDPARQAEALVQVAGALAKAGDITSASQVTAAACTVGRWTTAARSALLQDPSAFTMLARVLDDM